LGQSGERCQRCLLSRRPVRLPSAGERRTGSRVFGA